MTFVDTGAWFASVVPSDPDHPAAAAWLAADRGPLLTTDYVIDETLTLLLARGQKARAVTWGEAVFGGELTAVHYLSPAELRAAFDLFRRFTDKGWSFTDCTSKVVLDSLGLTRAFSFDQHFRQFGTVTVVP
jgi:uncharacterized protein